MAATERSFGNVFEDILDNFQALIRGEVRLAKSEFLQELKQTKSAALILAFGAMAAMFGILFMLLAAVFALSQKMPIWAAALVISLGMIVLAWATLATASRAFNRQMQSAPKSEETLKEYRPNESIPA